MFQEISEELKQARIKNNITVEQLSARTKIDTKFIEAIEIGDFAFLPELYVKAFIKQYAKAVDLDENIIVKKYEAIKSGTTFEEQKESEPKQTAGDKPKSENQSKIIEVTSTPHTYDAVREFSKPNLRDSFLSEKSRFLLGGIIVAVVIIFAFVYFFFMRKTDNIVIPEKSFEEIVQENKERYISNEPAGDSLNANTAAVSDSLKLTILAGDTSWVKIIIDGKSADEFILFPNSQKVVAAGNNFKITFGNSGGINLRLNDKPLSFDGKESRIKYVLVNKNGLKYLSDPPSL